AGVWWELATAGVEPLTPGLVDVRRRVGRLVAETGRSDATVSLRAPAGTALVQALSDAGRAVHAAGHGPPRQHGRVAGIHVSNGGVPKMPVESVAVGWRGLAGDRQASRRHHGRIWQAISLWSAEAIAMLVREGHPIFPGAAGENVTVAGIDWGSLRPGTRLQVGEALLEITMPALPCAKNARWFRDGDFNRMHHERQLGVSRLYALVVVPGQVTLSDGILVEP
ncbi:MAG TPA: MOSC domain-containing protein, partial [Acidimicrobiales bacterium]|nr:MOSC domain-containing protein [Acidimicrobiales bacterium]